MTTNEPASWNSSQIKPNHERLQPVNVLLVRQQSDSKRPIPCVCDSANTAYSLSTPCPLAYLSPIFFLFITRVCTWVCIIPPVQSHLHNDTFFIENIHDLSCQPWLNVPFIHVLVFHALKALHTNAPQIKIEDCCCAWLMFCWHNETRATVCGSKDHSCRIFTEADVEALFLV